jgi:hypothetical protein
VTSRGDNFSEHDPSGQAIAAAGGVTHYDRSGWRRRLVPIVLAVVALAVVGLAMALLTR